MVTMGSASVSGWIVVASIWTGCEIILPNRDAISPSKLCPPSVLSGPTVFGTVLSSGLVIIKDTLAWVLVAGYVLYLVSASIAWWQERKAEKDDRELGMELESF
jgi:hypothetical protein